MVGAASSRDYQERPTAFQSRQDGAPTLGGLLYITAPI